MPTFVCLSSFFFFFLFVCLSVFLCSYLFIYLSIYMSIYLSIHLYIYLFICLSVYRFFWAVTYSLCICQFVFLPYILPFFFQSISYFSSFLSCLLYSPIYLWLPIFLLFYGFLIYAIPRPQAAVYPKWESRVFIVPDYNPAIRPAILD